MDNDTIMLIGGIVIGLVIITCVLACYIILKKRKEIKTKYNNLSESEKNILESDTYNYSEIINAPEFLAIVTSYLGRNYNEIYPGDVIIAKNFVKVKQSFVTKTYTRSSGFGFGVKRITIDETSYTQANAAKRAAVGAVIAGTAGAVVGGLSAAETNKCGGVEHHTLIEIGHHVVSFFGPEDFGIPHADCILLSNELMERLKASPEIMECIEETDRNYIKMPELLRTSKTNQQVVKLAEWLNKNIINY